MVLELFIGLKWLQENIEKLTMLSELGHCDMVTKTHIRKTHNFSCARPKKRTSLTDYASHRDRGQKAVASFSKVIRS